MIIFFEAIILALTCSIDAFAASFAYGTNKIKIPFISNQIINFICCTILGISLLFGAIVRNYIPSHLTIIISFIILFILGIIKLFDSITKSLIRKYNNITKELKFSFFNFKFILKLYADPEDADIDSSRDISPTEAVALAFSLSLDGLAIGFGAALSNINILVVVIAALLINMIALISGVNLGNKLAKKSSVNLSWISGVILIILAFSKLF